MRPFITILVMALTMGAFGFIRNHLKPGPGLTDAARQSLLAKQQGLVGSPVHPLVGGRPKKAPDPIALPQPSAIAASVVASSARLVAQSKQSGPLAQVGVTSSSLTGPAVAVAIGLGGFLLFWVAGKRQDPPPGTRSKR